MASPVVSLTSAFRISDIQVHRRAECTSVRRNQCSIVLQQQGQKNLFIF